MLAGAACQITPAGAARRTLEIRAADGRRRARRRARALPLDRPPAHAHHPARRVGSAEERELGRRHGPRLEESREMAALGRERFEKIRARHLQGRASGKRRHLRVPLEQPRHRHLVLPYQHPAPVHRHEQVARRIERQPHVPARHAGAGRAGRRAERGIVVRRRQRGEMPELRIGHLPARSGGEECVHAGDHVAA